MGASGVIIFSVARCIEFALTDLAGAQTYRDAMGRVNVLLSAPPAATLNSSVAFPRAGGRGRRRDRLLRVIR